MHRESLIGLAVVICGGGTAWASKLPGTLNFQNVTASRINQTVPEEKYNEKIVEYGDFDNDNDLDVLVAVARGDFSARLNKLYRNDGGTFNEVSGAPIIAGFEHEDVSRAIFFRDYDRDGWLDVYVVNDSNAGMEAGTDRIYMNVHPDGVFSHFEDESALRIPFGDVQNCKGPACTGASCAGVSFDPDGDQDQDIYVGNYPNSDQDRLYHNDNDNPGFFIEATATHVPDESGPGDYTVDVATADMNGDGRIDLLISNRLDSNKIYYNNNLNIGSGLGDFDYPESVQDLGASSTPENAMEPGDFEGDGDQDAYWCNHTGAAGDRIMRNIGNGIGNKAVLLVHDVLPPSVTNFISRKATVADLNGDGRPDVVVGKDFDLNNRPTVLRNTSVTGVISFVDWTPAPAFPTGSVHRGWHAVVFDSNGDQDMDIFLGGWADDHLFEQVPEVEYNEDDLLGGVIPNVYNQDPAAVLASAAQGEIDTYTVTDLDDDAFIAIVINGPDDYAVEVVESGGKGLTIATSDRGGIGIEEALQVEVDTAGDHDIRVTILACAAPIYDLDGDCGVGVGDLLALFAAWGENPGHPADFDGDGVVGVGDLLQLFANWGPAVPAEYILEVLSRNG